MTAARCAQLRGDGMTRAGLLSALAATVIFLCGAFAGTPARAQMDCGDFWERGAPVEATGGAFACREFTPSDPSLIVGPGTDYRIFYSEAWHTAGRSRPGTLALLDTLAEGFDRSVRHYDDLGLALFPIYFMVGDGLAENLDDWPFVGSDWDTSAEVPLLDEWAGGPCPVTTFVIAFADMREAGPDVVKQLAAHEVFHCVQWFNFATQIPGRDDNDWIGEGTAEYFSSEVYPCANNEHGFSSGYAADTDIVEQSYETAVFFHHLANVSGIGEAGVLDLMRQQSGGSRSAQRRELAGFAGMDGMFHEFGKDYVDNDIPDCGGLMPVQARKGELQVIEDEGEVEISAETLMLARYQVKLKKGKKYQISRLNEQGSGRLSWRRDDNPSSWAEVPEEIEIPCDESETHYIVATTTAEDGEPYEMTLRFKAEEGEGKRCCVDTGEQDRCVVGTWRADDQAMAQWLSSVFAQMSSGPSSIRLNNFEADARFTADRMGAVRGIINDARGAGEMRQPKPGGGTTVTQFTIEGGGASLSRWSTEGNRTLHLCPRESDVGFLMTMTGEFGTFSMPVGPPPGGEGEDGGGVEFAYQCSANQITITHEVVGLPPQNYRATKISE